MPRTGHGLAGGRDGDFAKDDWGTPLELFQRLDAEFHFTLDAAASEWNAKCPRFYTREHDALTRSWAGEVVFLNPPYGRGIGAWVAKAAEEADYGATVVVLTFARTDTAWWHTYVEGIAEVRFLRGRVKFLQPGGVVGTAPAPSVVLIYRPRKATP